LRLADQAHYLLMCREPPLRRELVDCLGKHLGQNLHDLILGEAGALGEGVDNVWTKCIRNLAG